MRNRKARGGSKRTVSMMSSGGGIRLGMLTTTANGIGNEEGRRMRRRGIKTAELNSNWTLDLGQDQAFDQIPTYIPPIILPNPHFCHCRLVLRHLGRRERYYLIFRKNGGHPTEKQGVGRRG